MFGDIAPGTILAEKFRLERVLGQGNMGLVLLATHLQLDQQVALKFLLPSALSQSELEARFAQEARSAAKIKSEHVARVIDVSALDDGTPYIVMEYLEGTDLAKQLARNGPLPVAQAVVHVLQACEALAEAHAAGIVHRDLKLSNLFVASYPDGTPCIKVLDFGISKYNIPGSDPDLSMTDTGAVMGSPLYMSPEQMRSTRNVDARSDIWALGVILYELVAGRAPFDAQTMPLLCSMVLQDEPPPLGRSCPALPRGFEAVVLRCLEKDRAQRFQNVHQLARALAEYAPLEAQRSLDRIARLAGWAPPHSGARGPASDWTPNPSEPSPFAATVHPMRRSWAAGIALAVVVALAFGMWRWVGPAGSRDERPAALAAPPVAAVPTPPAVSAPAVSAPAPSAPAASAPAVPGAPSLLPPAPAAAVPAPLLVPSGAAPNASSPSAVSRSPQPSRPKSKAPARRAPSAAAPSEPAAPAPPAKPSPLDGRL